MNAGIIIPARLGSTRLPKKMLLDIEGMPLIARTYENAKRSKLATQVVVATDSEVIADCINGMQGHVIMTSPNHKTGTERCAEAVKEMDLDIIINVQGDEPFVSPNDIDGLIELLAERSDAEMATLRYPISNTIHFNDPNIVKVVCSSQGQALYFSRAPIPYNRDQNIFRSGYKHIGVYAYRIEFLIAFAGTTPNQLEEIEKLEQLRALDMGAKILIRDASSDTIGIDTNEDLARAQKYFNEKYSHHQKSQSKTATIAI